MLHKRLIPVLILACLVLSISAQVEVHTGLGYQENFSIGIGFHPGSKGHISANYGTDLPGGSRELSCLFLQYDYTFGRVILNTVHPVAGIKVGYMYYKNYYYHWELIPVVAFSGLKYPLNKHFDFLAETGLSYNRELSLDRINTGDIGWYRRILPEFKIGIEFKFIK